MQQQLLYQKKIAIIGAGPVGLTLASILQQHGTAVKVYERDENASARIMGGTLDIHIDTGQRALEKAGLLGAFYAVARPTGERAANMDGEIVMQEYPEADHLYDRPEIDRNDLRTLLLNSLLEDTVIWNKKFTALEAADGAYQLHFENNIVETADVVIGANGGMCNLRRYITGVMPQYSGTVIIQGEVVNPGIACPNFIDIAGDGNLMVMGEGKMLFSQTKANGDLNYYISFREPESWLAQCPIDIKDKDSFVSFLNEILAGWHQSYRELFAVTATFTLLPMRNMPLDKPWKIHSNITLVGDAAHVMPPLAGVGVNVGLLDALYLAENLTGGQFETIQDAIADYELKMFEYAAKAQEDTAQAETGIHSDDDVSDIIKDRR